MRGGETYAQEEMTYCLRHPDTESNLRCGRCNDLICPRCMVTSPVGARCPSCARIGRPAILDTSSQEMTRAILAGMVAAVIGALLFTIGLKIFTVLPYITRLLDLVVIAGGFAGVGYLVGEAVRYGSGKKIDRRLKYVSAAAVFVAWLLAFAFSEYLFNVPSGFVVSIVPAA